MSLKFRDVSEWGNRVQQQLTFKELTISHFDSTFLYVIYTRKIQPNLRRIIKMFKLNYVK